MTKVLCSIYDSKAEYWSLPMCFHSEAQAVREFGNAVNGNDTEYGRHPEDYTVFALGTFDESTGTIDVFEVPSALAVGIILVKES